MRTDGPEAGGIRRRVLLACVALGAPLAGCRTEDAGGGRGWVAFAREPRLTIRLDRFERASSLRLGLDGPYEVVAEETGRVLAWGRRLDDGLVEPAGETIRVNGMAVGHPGWVRIVPRVQGTPVRVEGIPYPGIVSLRSRGHGGLEARDEAALERYIEGVVAAEMPPSWPLEALRAQAVAARSYAADAVSRHAGRGPGATLADSGLDQVYRGCDGVTPRVVEAVRSTAGQVLTWHGAPLRAYFHSTCGGRTCDPRRGFGAASPAAAPLRGVECGFCEDAPRARWTCTLSRAEIRGIARGFGLGGEAVEVHPEPLVPGERLAWVRLDSEEGSVRVSAPEFRRAAGADRVRSTWWVDWEDTGRGFAIGGRGWGHGVGLCQYGARGMARAGLDARAILAHYYPGAATAPCYPAPPPPPLP